MKHAFAPLAAVFLLAISAAASAKPGPVCLEQRQVYDWQPAGDHAVIAIDRAHRKYKITFRNVCSGLDYNLGVRFRSRGVTSLACLSRGDEVTARAVGPFPNPHCVIDKVEYYTRAMQRADAAAARMAPR